MTFLMVKIHFKDMYLYVKSHELLLKSDFTTGTYNSGYKDRVVRIR